MDFGVIWARVQRAVKLEEGVFAEIGSDDAATVRAMAVMAGASLISGLGPIIGPGRFSVVQWIIGAVLSATIVLGVWTGIVWILTRLFGAKGGYLELFRGMGYAGAPTALGIIPIIGGIVGGIWALVLAVRATAETQSLSTGKAAAAVLIPIAILFLFALLVGAALFAAFMAA